ncbi:aldolase/citrate lyase family protein [Acidobacteria bacterium AH-259-O06]|nr:aldolase/citrate lyase family protein [Acidobacteria bacterium AH-259-O06]
MMNRRHFTMTVLGVGAGALSASGQPRAVVQSGSLKQRVHARQPIRIASAPTNSDRSRLQEILKRGPVDLFHADGQHAPLNERELLNFCTIAEELGVGVRLRIKHPRQAFLLGNYADLGPLAIVVPLVEDEQTVREAINAFYFPPLGRRSWGSVVGFKKKERPDRLEYAQWWNANAILCLQIESLRAALNVRNLVKPAVDWILFGPADLSFDLELHSHSPFKTVGECADYVAEQLKGVDVRVAGRNENVNGISVQHAKPA